MRIDKRANFDLRPIKIEVGYLKHHEGSVLISQGDTKVLCVATSENKVPHYRMDVGGWLSAEYSMLPGSTAQRKQRAISRLKNDGRTMEISRLIGRSLRQAIDLKAIGQRTINIDCDIIQADAGTRCAAITGAYVALCAHIASLLKNRQIKMTTMEDIIIRPVAAVSLGILKEQVLLDINYEEDIKAQADCNLVGSSNGQIIEFQCTAEEKPLSKETLDQVYQAGQKAIGSIIELQHKELMRQCGIMFHR